MVSAWANTAGLILGQKRVNEKTNEITAIPELLDMLEIEGCVITIDAMGTQKEVTKKIIEKNGDYILAVKGNHGTLQEDVELFFEGIEEMKEPNDQFDYYKTLDKDHGRIESREYWVTTDIDWFDGKEKWEDLKSFCMMKTKRTVGEHTSVESLFYISSLDLKAKEIGKMIRSHWAVENSLHWVLDVAFREDECRKRKDNSAENFAVLRRITLNLLKQEKTCKRSIAGKRLLAGWDQTYMEKILFKT